MVACFFSQQHQLVAAFAQGHEEGQEAAKNVEPGGKTLDGCNDHNAGGNAQDKPGGDDRDVDEHDVLEPERIGNLRQQVGQQNEAKVRG